MQRAESGVRSLSGLLFEVGLGRHQSLDPRSETAADPMEGCSPKLGDEPAVSGAPAHRASSHEFSFWGGWFLAFN